MVATTTHGRRYDLPTASPSHLYRPPRPVVVRRTYDDRPVGERIDAATSNSNLDLPPSVAPPIERLWSAVLLSFSTTIGLSFEILQCTLSLVYHYILLLGLCFLDSLSAPLDKLAQLVAVEAAANDDNRSNANAFMEKTWETYLRSLGRDLEMTSALCAAVLALTIGLLSITSIAEEVVTKTIACVCMFACAAGIAISLNMRRHLNSVCYNLHALKDWVCAVEALSSTRYRSVPMLLAAPWAWTAWSAMSFIVTLLSFVWRPQQPSPDASATRHFNSFTTLLTSILYVKARGDDAVQTSSDIVVLPWQSRIILSIVFFVIVAHFTLVAICFRKLGVRVPVSDPDAELGNIVLPSSSPIIAGGCAAEPGDCAVMPGCMQAVPTPAPVAFRE